ncbi:MAG: hypothetical protein Pg6C_19340 [Treponemataceae bacterium]|nr:MAG: hypothetical protein Pg6C_19340 [Treponemataceae bacterium]
MNWHSSGIGSRQDFRCFADCLSSQTNRTSCLMVKWVYTQLIYRRQCRERQDRVSTRIITAVPRMRKPAKGERRELSKKAKVRLEIIDYYWRSSARFSKTGRTDVTLTCRHFGIHRSYFYRWLARFER